jgi:hypothetical protein
MRSAAALIDSVPDSEDEEDSDIQIQPATTYPRSIINNPAWKGPLRTVSNNQGSASKVVASIGRGGKTVYSTVRESGGKVDYFMVQW